VHLVVDASVAVKRLIPEIHSGAAQAPLDSRNTLYAPDLIQAEITIALVNRHLAGDLARAEVELGIDDLEKFPVIITPGTAVLRQAVEPAIAMRRGAFDCYYLALARMRGIRTVTADKKFCDQVSRGQFASHVPWIADTV